MRKLPTVTIAPKTNSNPVTEGTAAVFTVSRMKDTANALTVNLHVDDATNSDFVSGSNEGDKTVIVPAGSASVDYSVATQGDTTDEPDGPVSVTVKDGTSYKLGDTSSATRTVQDDDATTVTLTGAATDLTEGSAKTFTLSIGRGLYSGESLSIPLTFSGTATRGATGDYTLTCSSAVGVTCSELNGSGPTVTFTGPSTGQTDTSVTLTLTALSDNTRESGETMDVGMGTVTATGSGGGVTTTDSFGQFTINDEDATVVTLTGTTQILYESNSKPFTLSIPRGLLNGESLSIPLTFSGTATRGTTGDYTLTCSSAVGVTCSDLNGNAPTVTFTGPTTGKTDRSVPFNLEARSDNTVDGGETVNIGIGTVTATGFGRSAGSPVDNSGEFIINDPLPYPTVSPHHLHSKGLGKNGKQCHLNEGGTINAELRLSSALSQWTDISYRVTNPNGSYGSGWQARPGLKDLPISGITTENNVVAPNGVHEVVIEVVPAKWTANPGQYSIDEATRKTTVLVCDNDGPMPKTLEFSPGSVSVPEGAGKDYKVTLLGQPTGDVTVTITGASGTDVTVDTDPNLAGNQDTLTFMQSDWKAEKTVRVT
ncbi:MAG: hypothetical protein F4Z10_08115, partial [Synechococcus sp. SB0666_bin_14]|nr:hypothetical protein [Synechococcus sp. SB0666_bin_14]